MSSAVAPERNFRFYSRGEIREEILTSFRVHMRALLSPDTHQPFDETEIAIATATKSRFWIEADAIDLALLGHQNNALFLADQVRIDRAATAWLDAYHATQWLETRNDAVGGSGLVAQAAVTGTIFVGSATIPDATAYVMTAPDGKRYQNLFTTIAAAGGSGHTPAVDGCQLTLKGIDTGADTNAAVGTVFVGAANVPPGAQGTPAAIALALFTGGIPAETDADFADRILDRVRNKPASGNASHIRSFARQASGSVEDAFVYCCALHAGTNVVCVTQKRGNVVGHTGRIANAATLVAARNYLTPPGSPVLPAGPFMLVLAAVADLTDLVVELSLPTAQANGWTDPIPWPATATGDACTVTAVTTQQVFQITREAGSASLPAGVTAPALMIWNPATWAFEALQVTSVTAAGGNVFDVVLSAAPTTTVAAGRHISPDTALRATISSTVEAYFDALGPGEVIDLTADTRANRAFRWPQPSDEYPQRVGSTLLSYLQDALGSSLLDSTMGAIVTQLPSVPVNVTTGPGLMMPQDLGLYPLI
jgi:uncharacterized phage protein gp47/JayE